MERLKEMIRGFHIVVAKSMVGMKHAVLIGDTFYVSPAMHSLMKDATPEELEHLFQNIPYVEFPKFDPFAFTYNLME